MTTRPPVSPGQAFSAARIIAIAMLLSGAMVTATGILLTVPSAEEPATGDAGLFFWMWVAVAVGATAAWWVLWRGAAGLSSAPPPGGTFDPAQGPGRRDTSGVLPRLIASYALLEGQLMMALAASIIGRTFMLLVPAATLFGLGILLSFPRREWFGPPGR